MMKFEPGKFYVCLRNLSKYPEIPVNVPLLCVSSEIGERSMLLVEFLVGERVEKIAIVFIGLWREFDLEKENDG
ncbi:MAG: hypothetical protein E6R04_11565 [Spirochaetes bacterium]|nr:MAG: hypothetical protein E6R04_11565 [Spirochaetota bacterium]